eukprot:m.450512 g.450512  ORF g.450512 m.450512 type:complete len:122 (+) comp21512_c0_seq25:1884-2249(+)
MLGAVTFINSIMSTKKILAVHFLSPTTATTALMSISGGGQPFAPTRMNIRTFTKPFNTYLAVCCEIGGVVESTLSITIYDSTAPLLLRELVDCVSLGDCLVRDTALRVVVGTSPADPALVE